MSTLSQFKQGSLLWRGEYATSTSYYPNNLVTYDGSIYICIQQSQGNLPTLVAYFELFAGSPGVNVETVGSGTDPATFTLTSDGATITLNKIS